MSEMGLVTLRSMHDAATTLQRLRVALAAKGITVYAEIDHAAGAASVGLPLRPTTLVIFGNPAAGTPLMQAAQTAGIDLPLKVLVWQDAQDVVQVSYNDLTWTAVRHELGPAAGHAVAALSAAVAALAHHAAGP